VRRAAAAAAVALAAVLAAPAARADEASPAQVRALARRAADDPAALERLRRVDRVGGRRVDLRAALATTDAGDLRARLRALAAAPSGRAPAADPRGEARSILSERRFRGSSVPRPFHGFVTWLGRKLDFIRRALEWLGDRLPGGDPVVWTLLAGLVVAVAAGLGWRVAERRAGRLVERSLAGRRERAVDPGRLEREADLAERRGELERALRLRFRAGLLRLSRAEAIPPRESLTSGEVRRLVRSPSFDRLAADFDEIVYGERPTLNDDVERARAGWPRVLEEARRR
jgi:Domain of unknown function (DUF4129)